MHFVFHLTLHRHYKRVELLHLYNKFENVFYNKSLKIISISFRFMESNKLRELNMKILVDLPSLRVLYVLFSSVTISMFHVLYLIIGTLISDKICMNIHIMHENQSLRYILKLQMTRIQFNNIIKSRQFCH